MKTGKETTPAPHLGYGIEAMKALREINDGLELHKQAALAAANMTSDK